MGNLPVTSGFPSERAWNAENVSIWWHHHSENSTSKLSSSSLDNWLTDHYIKKFNVDGNCYVTKQLKFNVISLISIFKNSMVSRGNPIHHCYCIFLSAWHKYMSIPKIHLHTLYFYSVFAYFSLRSNTLHFEYDALLHAEFKYINESRELWYCNIQLIPAIAREHIMMTSSNWNIFRVTCPLCGEFTGPRWITRTKASDAELWCFLWSTSE